MLAWPACMTDSWPACAAGARGWPRLWFPTLVNTCTTASLCSALAPPQIQNEQITAVLKKVEGEADLVARQVEETVERQSRLAEVLAKLARSLEHTEGQVRCTGPWLGLGQAGWGLCVRRGEVQGRRA